MDGIILINKEKNITSRDVCNMVSQKLNIKRVGHCGTLDPIATGLMIICVNEGCKIQELLMNHDKDYIAKVKIGIKTDTYDITGNIIERKNDIKLSKDVLIKTLNSFTPSYEQKVPIYSAIKVNGKKLYEYARENKKVDIPTHQVNIYNIKLLDLTNDYFTFFVSVSSGTYIRSLINDIGNKLNVPLTMEALERTRVGEFKLQDASNIDNLSIIPIINALNIFKIDIKNNNDLIKKISNGVKIENIYNQDKVLFNIENIPLAIYIAEDGYLRAYRVFNLKKENLKNG